MRSNPPDLDVLRRVFLEHLEYWVSLLPKDTRPTLQQALDYLKSPEAFEQWLNESVATLILGLDDETSRN